MTITDAVSNGVSADTQSVAVTVSGSDRFHSIANQTAPNRTRVDRELAGAGPLGQGGAGPGWRRAKVPTEIAVLPRMQGLQRYRYRLVSVSAILESVCRHRYRSAVSPI